MHQFQAGEVCIFFQMRQYGVCIRSVFEQKIGPYKVCIFVNMGPFWKSGSTEPFKANFKNENALMPKT